MGQKEYLFEEIEIENSKFNQVNWISWKEKNGNSLEVIIDGRGSLISYVLQPVDEDPIALNEALVGIDMTIDFISENTTHIGDRYTSDNDLVFILLENKLEKYPRMKSY